jgi:hypothetical protein
MLSSSGQIVRAKPPSTPTKLPPSAMSTNRSALRRFCSVRSSYPRLLIVDPTQCVGRLPPLERPPANLAHPCGDLRSSAAGGPVEVGQPSDDLVQPVGEEQVDVAGGLAVELERVASDRVLPRRKNSRSSSTRSVASSLRPAAAMFAVIGSYGAKDRSLRGTAVKLDEALTAAGVPHDVKEYPEAGHSFLNDHDPSEFNALVVWFARLTNSKYHEPSAAVPPARETFRKR